MDSSLEDINKSLIAWAKSVSNIYPSISTPSDVAAGIVLRSRVLITPLYMEAWYIELMSKLDPLKIIAEVLLRTVSKVVNSLSDSFLV